MFLTKLLVSSIVWAALCIAQEPSIGRPTYTLSPGDHILIRVPQSEKLDGRIFEVDARGFIRLPSIGRVRAAGITLEDLQRAIARGLKGTTPSKPQVFVSEVTYRR